MLVQIETVSALRQWLEASPVSPTHDVRWRGLVPTMGALHAGHAELIRLARAECGGVVVSIFVNPLQFDKPDDLARYPRTLEADLAICRDLGVDVVFTPSQAEVYPQSPECFVDVGRLADHLCGKFRPGHFRGVATVVLKFLQMVQPHRAYFGQKDAQQLAIVKRLVSDFNVPVTIVEVPTVREPDGLAMSSRNRHLSVAERASATALYQALLEAQRLIASGERDTALIKARAALNVTQSDALKLEYLEIVDPATMQPVDRVSGAVRIAGAMWVGSTRLIDNVLAE
ncbi:MAG TPA: pantoate--beta-alanine ligase [Vicinamibacterales bacterium]|nr:pantoate--beta-alanine ligase [Vicinamibacterales bacterium]